MNKTITFFAKDIDQKTRLDKYLVKNLETLTRSQIKKIILSKNIKLNTIINNTNFKFIIFI